MKISLLRSLCCLVSLGAVRTARGEINPSQIAGNARWVVYADFNALRDSRVGKELLPAIDRLQLQAASPIRLDIPKVLATIGSVTAYGSNFEKDPKRVDGSLIIRGTPQLRKIVEALLIQANLANPQAVAEVKDLGCDAYALTAPNDKSGTQVIVALPAEPIVVASKSREQLQRTLALFRGGQTDSLEKNESSPLRPLLDSSAHAMVFAATVVPTEQMFGADAPQARILRMTHAASVALGEADDKTFAHVRLMASSDEMADKLLKILQGMAAMMSLAESSDQQLNAFLNSAVVSRDGDTVTLNLAYASDRLAAMIHPLLQPSPAGVHGGTGPMHAHEAGTVVATWTTQSNDDEDAPAPAPGWKRVQHVALVNGSVIILGEKGAGSAPLFDQIRIRPQDAPADSPAPWLYRRKTMTDTGMRRETGRTHQVIFPGEDGAYTLEVHTTPAAHRETTLTVRVINLPADKPAAPAAAEPASAADPAASSR